MTSLYAPNMPPGAAPASGTQNPFGPQTGQSQPSGLLSYLLSLGGASRLPPGATSMAPNAQQAMGPAAMGGPAGLLGQQAQQQPMGMLSGMSPQQVQAIMQAMGQQNGGALNPMGQSPSPLGPLQAGQAPAFQTGVRG